MLRPSVPAPRGGRRRPRRRLTTGSLLAVLVATVLSTVLPTAMVPTTAPAAATSGQPAADVEERTGQGQDSAADAAPVVLVGVTGLRWDDVRTLPTPALWDLSRDASIGTVATHGVRAAACPADGWLAVSAGARAADMVVVDDTCRTLREAATDDVVPGWQTYLAAVETQLYGAEPGLLGEVLAEAGTTVTGIGPGAAIALADRTGTAVGEQLRRPVEPTALRQAVATALESSQLVVVDAGTVRDPGHATERRTGAEEDPSGPPEPEPGEQDPLTGEPSESGPGAVDAIVEPTRAEQVRRVDDRVAAVLRAAQGTGATVLVVSLADSGRPALQLVAATGPAPGGGEYGDGLLTSGSTRQAGLVQTTDVTPTLLTALGLEADPAALVGAPINPTEGPQSVTGRLRTVHDIAGEALHITRVSGPYLTYLVLSQAVLFIAAAVLLARRGRPQGQESRRALRALQIGAVALGSAPIASFLTGLVPWWRADSPTGAFWLTLLGWVLVLSVLALLGPWRRMVLGPAGFVAGITVVVLLLDALTGSHLVIDGPMGAHRLVAARFYGMSNPAFAMLVAAGLLLATAVAQPLVDHGRRRAATLAVAAIGLVLTVVNGAPGLGSDFGGPPAIILGFAVLTIVVSGRRVRWRTLLLIVVVAGVVVAAFAGLDWLRPPAERTHLGRFMATVLDGGLADVVSRKLEVHLRVLTKWRYLVLAVGGALLTVLVMLGSRPRGRDGAAGDNALVGLREAVPLLSPCMAAIGLALGAGFLINDSGIVVPATGIAVAVPCLVVAAAQRRLSVAPVSSAQAVPAVDRSL